MVGQLTTAQFTQLCEQFGRDSFHRRPVDVRPTQAQIKGQLKPIIKWLEANCIAPFYITKERRSYSDPTRDIVFYFTDAQDKMVFTLCYGEIFT